jgi:hypothetical protein
MLYETDDRVLSQIESILLQTAKEKLDRSKIGTSLIPREAQMEFDASLSASMRRFLTLFPNNHLDEEELKNKTRCEELIVKFEALLNASVTERDILNFIRDNKAYLIIGSIFKCYNFGHHDAYLFREFRLSTKYTADFLLVGKSSAGFEFIFVELENPSGNITIQEGDFGETGRRGLKQLEDWDQWIDANFSTLSSIFKDYAKPGETLPSEFWQYDKTRIHYALVVGRRDDFNEKTYRLKRKSNIQILHYDNLVNLSRELITGRYY